MTATSTTLSRRTIHHGRILDIGVEEVRLPSGVVTHLDVLLHPGASLVVPMDGDGRVAMIRQYRHCARGELWEFPAGTLSPGEDPVACAHRELREEAGLLSSSLVRLGHIFTAPGFTDERIHLFVATGLSTAPAEHDVDEVITEVRWFSPAAVDAALLDGQLTDAKSLSAWLHVRTRAAVT
jgi:ADP-ribose pyrophosphatase